MCRKQISAKLRTADIFALEGVDCIPNTITEMRFALCLLSTSALVRLTPVTK